jgi:hypothetical protein
LVDRFIVLNAPFSNISTISWRPALVVEEARIHRVCKLQQRLHSIRSASDKVYQLLAHGRWFSPGILASSTIKTSRHDIAKKLLKVALNTRLCMKN